MGDRANVIIKCEGDQVVLYTHWMGTELPVTLQTALKRGQDRLNDFQYINRVIFNQMTLGAEMETTGYGISTVVCDNEHELIYFDVDAQTITIGDMSCSVAEYLTKELQLF